MRHYLLTALLLASLIPLTARADDSSKCPSTHEGPMAVFITPTDEDIERMKADVGEEDFYVIADDSLYYQWEAVEFLKDRGVPYCFANNGKHEFTVKAGGKKFAVNRECEGWCLILFNGTSEPVWANAAEIFMYEGYLKTGKGN